MKKINISLLFLLLLVLQGYAQQYQPGTTTAIWKNLTAADFRDARANGINYIEVALNQCYRNVPDEEIIPRIKAMKAKIDSAGVEVWSIHLPFSRTLDISVLDNVKRKQNIELIAKMIEECSIFRPSRLVLHPSSEPIADSIRAQRISNASQSIAYLKKYADEIGATLCIENLPRTCLGNTPEELLGIIRDIPGVMVCFDTNHYTKGTTEHFIMTAGNYIGTIHASDFDYVNESHWLPTQGDIQWEKLMGGLHKINYQGVFMYEAIKDRANNGAGVSVSQIAESFKQIVNGYKKQKDE